MKLIQSFGVNPAAQGGGIWLRCTVTDLGTTGSLHVHHSISQEELYRGAPLDRAVYNLRRDLERAIGDQLFEGLAP